MPCDHRLLIIILKPLIIISSIQYFFNLQLLETQNLINTYLNVRVFSVPAELSIYILVGFYLGIQKTKISSLINCCFIDFKYCI